MIYLLEAPKPIFPFRKTPLGGPKPIFPFRKCFWRLPNPFSDFRKCFWRLPNPFSDFRKCFWRLPNPFSRSGKCFWRLPKGFHAKLLKITLLPEVMFPYRGLSVVDQLEVVEVHRAAFATGEIISIFAGSAYDD